jgi:hypothetical protein
MVESSQTWLQLEQKIKTARTALLIAIAVTVINILMMLFDVDAYLFFSVSTAYYGASFGKGLDNGFSAGAWPENGIYTRTGALLALIILAVLLVLWFFAKDNRRVMCAAAVVLIVDSVVYVMLSMLLSGTPVMDFPEAIVHVYLIVALFQGGAALKELERRRMEAPEVPPTPAPQDTPWEL